MPHKRNPGADAGASDLNACSGTSESISTPYAPQRRWKDRNPLAVWSHSATRSAVRRGLLTRPEACENCGKAAKVDAHHDSHRDPLRVAWWCRSCHRKHHVAVRAAADQLDGGVTTEVIRPDFVIEARGDGFAVVTELWGHYEGEQHFATLPEAEARARELAAERDGAVRRAFAAPRAVE